MIFKLCLLGWNPYEIADVVSISRQRVEQILGKNSKNLTKVKNLLLQDFNNNKPIEQIVDVTGKTIKILVKLQKKQGPVKFAEYLKKARISREIAKIFSVTKAAIEHRIKRSPYFSGEERESLKSTQCVQIKVLL